MQIWIGLQTIQYDKNLISIYTKMTYSHRKMYRAAAPAKGCWTLPNHTQKILWAIYLNTYYQWHGANHICKAVIISKSLFITISFIPNKKQILILTYQKLFITIPFIPNNYKNLTLIHWCKLTRLCKNPLQSLSYRGDMKEFASMEPPK